jgi:colicin import membrane protein
MSGFVREHLRPLAGAAGLHVALLVALGLAAVHWRSAPPPAPLAIEGYVADQPLARPGAKEQPAPARPTPPPPAEVVEPPPRPEESEAARAAEVAREQQLVEERAAREKAEADRQREQEARREAEAAEAKRKAADEAARREAEAAEAKRKAAEEAARRETEAAEAKRKAAEQAAADREAKLKAERESDLKRMLAAEEEAAAVARSGVVDEYRALLTQTIERNWSRPPSAQSGLKCTLYVTQAPGGTVVDVRLGDCNGDQAVRESITTAVHKSSPLPAPRDPRAFERRLEIVFQPRE